MEARRFRLGLTAAFAAAILSANLLSRAGWTLEQSAALWPFRCPLLLWTGLHCPTCGLGRAMVAAMFGDWGRSWSFHPLGIPLVLLTGFAVACLWMNPDRIRRLLTRAAAFLQRRPALLPAAVFVYACWGFLRP